MIPQKRNEKAHKHTARPQAPANHYSRPLREPVQMPHYDPYDDVPPELDLRNYSLEEQAYYPGFGERLLMLNTANRGIRLPEPSSLDTPDDYSDFDELDHAGEW